MESKTQQNNTKAKKFKLPDIYIILSIFILIISILTYIVPAGKYERMVVNTPNGQQTLIVPNSYHKIEQTPAGFMEIITSIPYGLERASGIVFLTFLVGAGIGLIRHAGIVDLGIQLLSQKLGNKAFLAIPILMFTFTAIAAFIGTPELSLAYIPILLPLFYRLGYDGMTAFSVGLLGPCIGFIFGITIPGSVGLGQQIAQLPIFSGSGFRALILLFVWLFSLFYVMKYAQKVKKDPTKSLSYESDIELKAKILEKDEKIVNYTLKQKIAGIGCLIMFPCAIALILIGHLGFQAIGGLFLAIGIVASVIAGMKAQQICDGINNSMREMMVPALLCGVAASIAVVMDGGNITDTIINWLSGILQTVPPSWTAVAIYIEQSLFNILIPGATALTILTMPVLSPLATLLDISQQAVVSANAWGGQITDIFFPTSGFFIAALILARIEFMKWIRFYTPLLVFYYVIGSVSLYLMQSYSIMW